MKKWKQRMCAWMLFLAMLFTTINPSTAVSAAEPAESGHGLRGEWYFAADGGREDISRFTFSEDRYFGAVTTGNLNGEDLKPMVVSLLGHESDYVLAKFTGEIQIDTEADYTFYMIGDDGFRLYIDNMEEPIINFWKQVWDETQTSQPVHLKEGRHTIRVDYLQGWGGSNLKLEWSSEDAGIQREIVPESVLYLTAESDYLDAKDALDVEIKTTQTALELVKSNETFKTELETAINHAIALRDKDYTQETDLAVFTKTLKAEAVTLAATREKVKNDFCIASGVQASSKYTQFTNPLYQGQDPFVTQKDGFYYLVSSSNNDDECKIYVSKSQTLTDQGEKKMVMDVAETQRRVFAPEMFFFDDEEGGHWYVYYCADARDFNRDYPEMAEKYTLAGQSHIAFVMKSKTTDPMGEWNEPQPLYCGENNKIYGANDITAVKYDGSLFLIWGTLGPPDGQPAGPAIVEMDTPELVTKDRSMITTGDDYIGCGEGPRTLINKDGNLIVTMSEDQYATDRYCLSLLCNTGTTKEDLFNPEKWEKKSRVFNSSDNVSGPARASFVKSADGTEDWMIYHTRVYRKVDVNTWRQVNIKKFDWVYDKEIGIEIPNFGTPASTSKKYDLPSGDPGQGDMYQAENTILEGSAKVESNNSNYYGDGYVYMPNTVGSAVNFVVNAEEAGDYIVGLRYAYGVQKNNETTNGATTQLPSRAVMNIAVNGAITDKIEMDKTSYLWDEWFTGSKRMTLKEGANLITYSVDTGCIGDVRIDTLTMYKADVPFNNIPLTISVPKDYAMLTPGEKVQIQASVTPEQAVNKTLNYESDNTAVATVDTAGNVTAVAAGNAVIKITAAGNAAISKEFFVHVYEKQQPEIKQDVVLPVYLKLSKKDVELVVGKTESISVKIYPANAANTAVTFTSSDTAVASVDASGNIVANAPGSAVITATAVGDASVKQICTVTVNPKKVSWGKVTRNKKGVVTLKWKKQDGVTGYKIYRSEKKNGTYKLLKTVNGASKVSYVDKKAKKKKTYYYKICSYKKADTKTCTGDLSAVKTVKKK